MRAALLTREYPPEVYGGAGVHVEYLSRELARIDGLDVAVHCFGAPRRDPLVAGSYEPWDQLPTDGPGQALRALSVDLAMAGAIRDADVVHSHTWYANLGGHLAGLLGGVPHVVTAHSLEPSRPWKSEQLGGGYALSSWCERTAFEAASAIVAVSATMATDIATSYPGIDPARIVVIHNGIDPVDYRHDADTDVLERLGIDPAAPAVVFVGRLTEQKGVGHLLTAASLLDGDAQLIFCAGAPDTPEIGERLGHRAAQLARSRSGVHWITSSLTRRDIVQILSHATVFVCPSIYEPFGLINLEAMACGLPVVASTVGGIPEVVVDGVTGILVPTGPTGPAGAPTDPMAFASALAGAVDRLLADPDTAGRLGRAGRDRVLAHFTWAAAADKTASLYRSLVTGTSGPAIPDRTNSS